MPEMPDRSHHRNNYVQIKAYGSKLNKTK